MKAALVSLMILGFANIASATVYNCGMPKNAAGQVLMGGSSYQVENGSDGKVYLITSNSDTGHLVQTREEMTLQFRGVDAATFVLGNVTVSEVMAHMVYLSLGSDAHARCLPQ